jgi:hypothetical protein
MMEAARTSETLVNFYQTTRCYNPEDSNLQILYCCQNSFISVLNFALSHTCFIYLLWTMLSGTTNYLLNYSVTHMEIIYIYVGMCMIPLPTPFAFIVRQTWFIQEGFASWVTSSAVAVMCLMWHNFTMIWIRDLYQW